jgi:hypothetical protein
MKLQTFLLSVLCRRNSNLTHITKPASRRRRRRRRRSCVCTGALRLLTEVTCDTGQRTKGDISKHVFSFNYVTQGLVTRDIQYFCTFRYFHLVYRLWSGDNKLSCLLRCCYSQHLNLWQHCDLRHLSLTTAFYTYSGIMSFLNASSCRFQSYITYLGNSAVR